MPDYTVAVSADYRKTVHACLIVKYLVHDAFDIYALFVCSKAAAERTEEWARGYGASRRDDREVQGGAGSSWEQGKPTVSPFSRPSRGVVSLSLSAIATGLQPMAKLTRTSSAASAQLPAILQTEGRREREAR